MEFLVNHVVKFIEVVLEGYIRETHTKLYCELSYFKSLLKNEAPNSPKFESYMNTLGTVKYTLSSASTPKQPLPHPINISAFNTNYPEKSKSRQKSLKITLKPHHQPGEVPYSGKHIHNNLSVDAHHQRATSFKLEVPKHYQHLNHSLSENLSQDGNSSSSGVSLTHSNNSTSHLRRHPYHNMALSNNSSNGDSANSSNNLNSAIGSSKQTLEKERHRSLQTNVEYLTSLFNRNTKILGDETYVLGVPAGLNHVHSTGHDQDLFQKTKFKKKSVSVRKQEQPGNSAGSQYNL